MVKGNFGQYRLVTNIILVLIVVLILFLNVYKIIYNENVIKMQEKIEHMDFLIAYELEQIKKAKDFILSEEDQALMEQIDVLTLTMTTIAQQIENAEGRLQANQAIIDSLNKSYFFMKNDFIDLIKQLDQERINEFEAVIVPHKEILFDLKISREAIKYELEKTQSVVALIDLWRHRGVRFFSIFLYLVLYFKSESRFLYRTIK